MLNITNSQVFSDNYYSSELNIVQLLLHKFYYLWMGWAPAIPEAFHWLPLALIDFVRQLARRAEFGRGVYLQTY